MDRNEVYSECCCSLGLSWLCCEHSVPNTWFNGCGRDEPPYMRTKCKCGYSFLQRLAAGVTGFESYAVINDKAYQAFLKSEVTVLRSQNGTARLRAIGRSSQFVGSLFECGKCSRLLLFRPGTESLEDSPVIYEREDHECSPASVTRAEKRMRRGKQTKDTAIRL